MVISHPPERNGWIKYFEDGTHEEGYDDLVDTKSASWTRGRLSNMIGVGLKQDSIMVYLFSEDCGEFWQSDSYEAVMGSKPVRIARRIAKKLPDKKWQIIEIDLLTLEIRELVLPRKK